MSNATKPVARVQRVSEVVADAFNSINQKDNERKDAKDVLAVAADDAVNTREGQLVTLANISASEKWERDDIDAGIDAALKQRNGKDTAINTFATEIKRACHPFARERVSSLQELAHNVWDAEIATEDKSAPRPLRNTFARRYHMLQRMIKECIVSERALETSADVVEWAASLDPTKDPDKAFKRCRALRMQIQAVLDEFPNVEQLRACVEEIGTITVRDFKPINQPKSIVKPATVRKAAPAAETVDAEDITPAMGVSDLLDEALRDIEAT